MVNTWKEAFLSGDLHLLQHALAVNEDICIFRKIRTTSLNRDLPLPTIFLPYGFKYTMVEFNITVKVPFLSCFFEISMNLRPSCVEMAPIRLWIKRKCLDS